MVELYGSEFDEAMFLCSNCPWKKNEVTHWGIIKEVNEEPVGSSEMSIFQIWSATMIRFKPCLSRQTFVETLIK